MTPLYLGIDVGSTTIKVVVVDRAQQIYFQRYLRSSGQPRQTLLRVADELYAQFDPAQIVGVGFSGSGGETIARMVGGHHVNELIAQTRAVGVFHPAARTVIEIGGQDSKFLSLSWDEATGRMVLKDFAMNSLCAAGTGSFLDQQAERLGIAIEDEFARLALQADNPARIAGRCTVFAKSDMIHLQQKGTPLSDILFGLCMALARNFKSVVAKGKPFVAPILIQGGIAYNDAVVRAFERVLALEPGQLIVPEHHPYMAALGTAFIAIDNEATDTLVPFRGFAGLSNQAQARLQETRSMPPLPATPPRLATEVHQPRAFQAQPAPVYLGIDVGSISTNIVLVNEQAQVVARRYLHTAGKPLEAVRNALLEIRDEVGDRVVVQGVGTTGSGRYLTGDFVGGDVVRNEITAQARAAIAINPEVDTIFEIGGQDSKYISIHNGTIVDFAMNSACAAGTGSFLEEQAERLKISLRQDFSPMACTAECPSALGERCTVFMESDIIHHQQQGAQVDELSAGLAYAIAQNYLNRVVHRRQVGQTIFFQGGVANNQSVVAAFQQLTHKPITVPPHNDVTGAIGAALLAMDALTIQRSTGKQVPSNFKGFDLRDRTYQTTVFTCKACPNLCDINRVTISGEPPLFYGARCDKFEEAGRSNTAHSTALPDLFAERNELLVGSYAAPETPRNGRRRVAMPRALTYYDLFPYWRTFFEALDMDLVLSPATNPQIISQTLEHAAAESCFPVKLVYGHVQSLLDIDADFIFLPSVMDRETEVPGQNQSLYCPYISASAYMVAAQMRLRERGYPLLLTPLHFRNDSFKRKDLQTLAGQMGVPYRKVKQADAAAMAVQQQFYATVRQRGRSVLENLPADQPAAVIVGRPYNIHDLAISQDLPLKLRRLGVQPIPMDYLPLDTVDVSREFPNMNWRSGQDLLAAAALVRNDPRLHAIYVTNFSCGPDSFVLGYFERLMGDKPFLELEMDEHTADAGIITRCEAFFDSLRMAQEAAYTRQTLDSTNAAPEDTTEELEYLTAAV